MSLSLLALVSTATFVWTQPALDARPWVIASAVLASLVGALVAWKDSPTGVLRWDGQSWHWSGFATAECSLSLLVDFQEVLLVSLKSDGAGPVWLWLQAAIHGDVSWMALRRAIVSSRNASTEQAGMGTLEEKKDLA